MRSPSLPFTFYHFKWKSKKRQQVPKLYSNQTNKLVKEIATKMYTEKWRVKVDKTVRHGIRKLWGGKLFACRALNISKETFPCQASESDISVTLVLSSEDQALETAIFQTRFHSWFMTYVLFDLSEGTGWVKLWFNIDQTKVYNIWFVINTIKYKRFLEDICSFLYEHIKCFLERYVKAFFAQCVTWDVISAQSNQINVSQILTMMPNICFRLHPALFVGLLRDLPKKKCNRVCEAFELHTADRPKPVCQRNIKLWMVV